MSAPAACPLDDFGPLILRHHPVDVHQQRIFCSGVNLPVEEHDTHPHAAAFVAYKRLESVRALEAIWAMDRDELHTADGGQIASAFQGGSDQRGSTVPLSNEFARHRRPQQRR